MRKGQPSSALVSCQHVTQLGVTGRDFASAKRLDFVGVHVVANDLVAKFCGICANDKSCVV
jgi:hypothetical protein